MTPFNRQHLRGFTLIELISVLVLIGILSVAAISTFNRSDFEERGFFDELIQAVRYAQKVAVTSSCEVQVSLTANSYSLNLPNQGDCGNSPANYPNPVPGPKSGQFQGTTPAGISINWSASSGFIFDASGAASISQTITVGGFSFQVHGPTGYVERL
jgi:MSHA pilin protein MshC